MPNFGKDPCSIEEVIPIAHDHILTMYPILYKNVIKMSHCQKDVKYQKIKHLNYGGG